ncbi:GGDEF domain-containing protein [Actinotalea sp. M2MS4P-6]|uniref:GGDEF domain-containing protein n=1 Tax=Actinotalea sp. M2MS4P-6 TaxID=2983762 RepID=UPI0021E39F8B|nr:GGDEF domain-containing protein [Actinotalea sp. M2MS4P-6]MCV2393193.1 GGDEF domain-containing protein [Actinotalea sp. M2MS4P-6]
MTSGGFFEPRNRVAAGRTLVVVAMVAATVTVGYEVIAQAIGLPGATTATLVGATVVGTGLLVISIAAAALPGRLPPWTWVGSALIGVTVVLWVAFGTGDVSAGAQFGLVYPVVYAAANLRPGAAWFVTGFAALADAAVVLVQEPHGGAALEVMEVAAALLVLTAVLQMVAHHQDELTRRLAEIAAVDQLTGLSSRRRLEEVAHEVLETPCPPGDFGLGTGLAIIDLDHFKALNDTYGHPVGDAALVHVAALLRTTSPSRATVARLGGDELAVLLPCTEPTELRGVLDRFHDAVRTSPMNHLGRVLALSVSVGGAHIPGTREPTLAELYAEADEALYQAKLRGRGRVVMA